MALAPASVAVFTSAVRRDGDSRSTAFVYAIELLCASRRVSVSRVLVVRVILVVRVAVREVWPIGRIKTSHLGTDGTGAMGAG
jgi:hypothetical protein